MSRKCFFPYLVVLLIAGFGGAAAWANPGDVYVMTLSGSINPGASDYIKRSVLTATDEEAACLVIELDTPGGTSESMREIVQEILGAEIPVIVYVYPSGARAASAGSDDHHGCGYCCHGAGTNIGAAHPVGAGGNEIDETMAKKWSTTWWPRPEALRKRGGEMPNGWSGPFAKAYRSLKPRR